MEKNKSVDEKVPTTNLRRYLTARSIPKFSKDCSTFEDISTSKDQGLTSKSGFFVKHDKKSKEQNSKLTKSY